MVASPNKNVKRLNAKQKRTLVQLSVAQKQQVVLFATQNKDMTNLAIAEKFGKEFNFANCSSNIRWLVKRLIQVFKY